MDTLFANSALCLVGAVLFIALIFIANAIRIVPEYQRLIVFRFAMPTTMTASETRRR